MKEILDKLDELGVTSELLKEAQINKENSIREEKYDALEKEFLNEVSSFSEDFDMKDVYGKYREVDCSRKDKIMYLINDAVEGTASGKYKKGHVLHMQPKYGQKLLREAAKLFDYYDNLGQSLTDAFMAKPDDAQAYFNGAMVGKNGDKQDRTVSELKKTIQKINKLECIAQGEVFNYTSNIRTREELVADGVAMEKPKPHDSAVERTFKVGDYNKIADPIKERLAKGERVYDHEVAFVLAGEFGIRKETIKGLTVDDLNPKAGTIDIYDYNNKSEETFSAKSGVYPSQESKELLKGIYKRALLKNADKPTDSNQVPVITIKERQLYKGFDSMLKRNDIETEYGNEKFRALRRMYAQNVYDDTKEIVRGYRPELADAADCGDNVANAKLIAETITEVNYLMGHSPKHKDTTMGYLSNIY